MSFEDYKEARKYLDELRTSPSSFEGSVHEAALEIIKELDLVTAKSCEKCKERKKEQDDWFWQMCLDRDISEMVLKSLEQMKIDFGAQNGDLLDAYEKTWEILQATNRGRLDKICTKYPEILELTDEQEKALQKDDQ